MILTIGICTIPERAEQLKKVVELINLQKTDEVELIVFMDNRTIPLGVKRKMIADSAKGKYISYVDDDDRIYKKYVKIILNAAKHDPDLISIKAEYSADGAKPIPVYFDINDTDRDGKGCFIRIPNHLCAIKTSIVKEIGWSGGLGCDFEFSARLKAAHLERNFSQIKTKKTLYFYDYNSKESSAIKYPELWH